MSAVAGVDGCKAGWIVIVRDIINTNWQFFLCDCFHDVLNIQPRLNIVAVDMPIGLLDVPVAGGRACDQSARNLLGWPRRNSVFSPPSRPTLQGNSFAMAQRLNQPAGLTQQAFSLFPKLRQVEEIMTPNHQKRFFEVHPEVSFCVANNGVTMQNKKKSKSGQQERINVLRYHYGSQWNAWWPTVCTAYLRRLVALDDILDACIAAWTAERIYRDTARRIPNNPPTDSKGLRMEIWY
jgi:predicted RNase H-like nuclease